jgi:hypothetical protein
MTRKVLSVFLVVVFLGSLLACEMIPEKHKGAAVGAGVGAAAGTVAGVVIGKSVAGAVVGGLVGALIGGVIGHYAYDREKSRDQTAKEYSYKPSDGVILRIKDANAVPQTLKAGEEVKLQVTYVVLTPEPQKALVVTETREVTYQGQLVGRPVVQVQHIDGTYTTTVPIKLPPTAKKGLYRVRVTVESGAIKDIKDFTFKVI